MTTKVHDRTTRETTNIGGIGEDRGGIPVIIGLTVAMVLVIFLALGYLIGNAPGAGYNSTLSETHQPTDKVDTTQGVKPGDAALPPQQ